MSDLHLLPWLRRGLADHVAGADPLEGAIGPARLPLRLTVAGTPVQEEISLLAPHRVAAIAAGEIVRRYPVPGAVEVETNYFPLAEFAAPDVPWRYTPAAPASRGRLRPWLALVVVEDGAEGIAYDEAGATGRLDVATEQLHQLPDPGEVWGWAHVQSSLPVEEVAAAVTESPDALRSRIVCPRRLQPGRTYRAALVNAFAAGEGEASEPAWTTGAAAPVSLVVYDTWTFTTAEEAGDFESLCELLEPAYEVGELGVRDVDVTSAGLPVEWPKKPMVVDLVGALADPGVISDAAPPGTDEFADAAVPILDAVLGRGDDGPDGRGGYDALRDDPVVGLPFYGSWPAGVDAVPDAGWARGLNLGTTRRMAAGLGARTVRRNQETLMAAAWDQLGSVREAADELNRGRLSAEVGRCWQLRVAAVDPGDRLAIAAPLLTFVTVAGRPARDIVDSSLVPTAVLDRVWLRRTPRARGASASGAFVKSTGPDAGTAAVRAFRFRTVATPKGMFEADSALSDEADPVAGLSSRDLRYVAATDLAKTVGGAALAGFVLRPAEAIAVDRPVRRPRRVAAAGREATDSPLPDLETVPAPGTTPVPGGATAADVAEAVAALDPLMATRASLVARIPALGELLPAGELPPGLALAPEFEDALFWDLAELDDDVIVPGLDAFPNNRVRLLAVNPAFVGAYLVGANHELAKELVWREYPADLTATFFARFFDYGAASTVDITPIAGWKPGSAISGNVPNAAETTVILIRGDLVRRYPEVNVFLTPTLADRRADYAHAVEPSFEGRLGTDVLVVGFPEPPGTVLGEDGGREYYVVLEERMVAPRFGLDVTRDGALTTWDELAWTDFPPEGEHLPASAIPGLGKHEMDTIVWGRNAAHLAAAVHQKPFRRLYPASELVVR